jgi:hypothetical protein
MLSLRRILLLVHNENRLEYATFLRPFVRVAWYAHCISHWWGSGVMNPRRTYLTDDDIRFEVRVMRRWCRMFKKTALDWVNLEAKRFRDRHPVLRSAKAFAA